MTGEQKMVAVIAVAFAAMMIGVSWPRDETPEESYRTCLNQNPAAECRPILEHR